MSTHHSAHSFAHCCCLYLYVPLTGCAGMFWWTGAGIAHSFISTLATGKPKYTWSSPWSTFRRCVKWVERTKFSTLVVQFTGLKTRFILFSRTHHKSKRDKKWIVFRVISHINKLAYTEIYCMPNISLPQFLYTFWQTIQYRSVDAEWLCPVQVSVKSGTQLQSTRLLWLPAHS